MLGPLILRVRINVLAILPWNIHFPPSRNVCMDLRATEAHHGLHVFQDQVQWPQDTAVDAWANVGHGLLLAYAHRLHVDGDDTQEEIVLPLFERFFTAPFVGVQACARGTLQTASHELLSESISVLVKKVYEESPPRAPVT